MLNANQLNPDIGYCLSYAIQDYRVNMSAEICFLLSNPLWLGINMTEDGGYSPIEKETLVFLNPQYLESFSVNANCLFLPVRSSDPEHFTFLEQRCAKGKRTLVKLSSGIFPGGSAMGSTGKHPVLAVVEKITVSQESNTKIISLVLSANHRLDLSEQKFLQYWHTDFCPRSSTEWFAMIPSQSRMSEELLISKIKVAVTRQGHLLSANDGRVTTGYAVLEFLLRAFQQPTSKYASITQQLHLWQNKHELISYREKYAQALHSVSFINPSGVMLLAGNVQRSADVWQDFLQCISNGTPSTVQLQKHYRRLIENETNLIQTFNRYLS